MPRIAAALAVFLTVVTCIGFNNARYPVVWEMVAASERLSESGQSEESAAAGQAPGLPPSAAAPKSASPPESEITVDSPAAWQARQDSANRAPWASPMEEAVSMGPAGAGERSRLERNENGPPIGVGGEAGGRAGWPEPAGRQNLASKPAKRTWGVRFPSPADRAATSSTLEDVPPHAGKPVKAATLVKYARPVEPTVCAAESINDDQAESPGSETLIRQRPLVPVNPPKAAGDVGGMCRVDASAVALPGAGDSAHDALVRPLPPVDQVWKVPRPDKEPPLSDTAIPIYPTTGVD